MARPRSTTVVPAAVATEVKVSRVVGTPFKARTVKGQTSRIVVSPEGKWMGVVRPAGSLGGKSLGWLAEGETFPTLAAAAQAVAKAFSVEVKAGRR